MKNAPTFLISMILGLTIIASASGIPSSVFYHTRTFSILGVSAMTFVASAAYLSIYRGNFILSGKDILCFFFILIYLIDFMHPSGLWNLGTYALLMLFVMLRCCTQIYYSLIFVSCLSTACILACWGYLQYFEVISSNNEYFLLVGPFYNPSVLAAILALLIGIMVNTIILYYRLLSKRSFILIGIIVIVCIPVLLLSFSRAAYVALLASVLYVLFQKFVARRKRKKILYFSGGLLLVLFFAGASCAMKPQSANGRLLIWKVGLRMVSEKPLSGFGKGGFAANYLYYQAEYLRTHASLDERELAGNTHLAFNEPLRITVEYGLVGLLLYLAFIIWILFPSKRENAVSIISKSLLTGITIWGLFANPDQTFPVLTLWVIGVACSLYKSGIGDKSHSIKERGFLKLIFVCCFVAFGNMLYSKWKAYHDLQLYLNMHSMRDISEYAVILPDFKGEMNGDVFFVHFYCQVMRAGHQDADFLHSLNSLEKSFPSTGLLLMKGDYWREKKLWADAEKAYRLAADMVPSLQMPRGRLALLYNDMGRKQEALAIVREILSEKVKVYGFATFTLHRDLKRIFEDELK